MKIKSILLSLVLNSLFFGYIHAQIPLELQQRLQDTLNAIKNQYNCKGLSVAVGYKNNGIWKSAIGEAAPSVPLKTNHLIGIGSNTKTFVSATMLKLMENGKVNLSDSIGKWIQGYNNINGKITVHQLLNHTSGLYSYTDHPKFVDSLFDNVSRIWTAQELLNIFIQPPLFSPGSSFHYSNTNYLIAGMIEEAILNQPLHKIIRDSILIPLQLKETFYPPYETASLPIPEFYISFGTNYFFTQFPFELNTSAQGAGAMISTAEDNVKFWQALFNGQVIKNNTLIDSMLELVAINSNFGYGLGVHMEKYFGNKVFGHGGTWIGQINSNICDTTRKIFITVLSNQDSLDNAYTDLVVEKLYQVMLNYKPLLLSEISKEDNELKVYPNPASSFIELATKTPLQSTQITILDNSGNQVFFKEGLNPSGKIYINALPNGVYYLSLNTGNHVYKTSFVKQD